MSVQYIYGYMQYIYVMLTGSSFSVTEHFNINYVDLWLFICICWNGSLFLLYLRAGISLTVQHNYTNDFSIAFFRWIID